MSRSLVIYRPADATPTYEIQALPIIGTKFAPVTQTGRRSVYNCIDPAYVNRQERMIFQTTPITNFYAKAPEIHSMYRSPFKGGTRLYYELQQYWGAEDLLASELEWLWKVRIWTGIEVPRDALVTSEAVETLLKRHLGQIYWNNSVHFNNMLSGSSMIDVSTGISE